MSPIRDSIIVPYLKDNKKIIFFYIIVILISYILGKIIIPKQIIQFFNFKFISLKNFKLKDIFKKINIFTIIIIIIIISIINPLIYRVKLNLQHYFRANMTIETRIGYIKKLIENNLNNYKELSESELTYLYKTIFWNTEAFLDYLFVKFIPFICIFLIVSLFLFFNNIYLGLLVFFHFISMVLIFKKDFEKMKIAAINNFNQVVEGTRLFGDKIKNLNNIINENTFSMELKEITNSEKNIEKSWRHLFHKTDNNSLEMSFAKSFLIIGTIFISYYLRSRGDKTNLLTSVVILLIYLGSIDNFFENDRLIRQIIDMEELNKKIKFNVSKKRTIKNINKIKFLKLQNIYFKYQKSNKYIIENLSIDFLPNKINVLLGKSGSGKTTIMNLINKIYRPIYGKIIINNIDINHIDTNILRENIYYCNQKTTLFDKSIIYNMQYGNNFSSAYIISLLKKYDLLKNFKFLPQKLNTMCGINGSNLSLGMQKIIMVIRGILKKNHQIIIFDEPLTSLDKLTKINITKMILEECIGKTIIIITHDDYILPFANKIIKI